MKTLTLMLMLTLALGLPGAGLAAPCPARDAWPTHGWDLDTQTTATQRPGEIAALEKYSFTLSGADADRLGVRTDGVVIVHGGKIVYERYARSFKPDMPHYTWSVSKSVVNAFVGLAVQMGTLRISDSVCAYVPTIPMMHCDITIQDLLEFASGLEWVETYEGQSNQVSSVLAMLYGEGHQDMMAFVAGHPSAYPPGTTYMYSSGDSTFLMGVVNRALLGVLPPEQWDHYEEPLLFDVLGMDSATFERDAAGTPVGSSFVYTTPRDMAKFGFFFLNDGCWEDQRLLPEGWVADSTAVTAPFKMKALGRDPGDVQGRQWWLNRPVPEQSVPVPWPDVPQDAYAARGHWGQSITVIPSLDLVIVRVADDRDGTFDFNHFLALAIAVGR